MGIGIPMNQANTPFMTFSFAKQFDVSWLENASGGETVPENQSLPEIEPVPPNLERQ